MANELKAKWIEDLRSGEYEQGEGNLKSPGGVTGEADYCCLGVLIDRCIKDGLVEDKDWIEVEDKDWIEVEDDGRFEFRGKGDFPPAEILDLVGITFSEAQELATFNDNYGYSFEDIANFLEYGTRLIDHDSCEAG
jgi:hypothetical protein